MQTIGKGRETGCFVCLPSFAKLFPFVEALPPFPLGLASLPMAREASKEASLLPFPMGNGKGKERQRKEC